MSDAGTPSRKVRPLAIPRSGSVTGTSTPVVSYGSITSDTPAELGAALEWEARQRSSSVESHHIANSIIKNARKSKSSLKLKVKKRDPNTRRRWSASTEQRARLGPPARGSSGSFGGGLKDRRSISQAILRAVAGASDEEEDGYQAMRGHRRASTYFMSHPTSHTEAISTWTSARTSSALLRPDHRVLSTRPSQQHLDHASGSALEVDSDDDSQDEQPPIPYGVRKMEAISRFVSKSLLYSAVYLITLFTSLSSTTTPAVEPFLLSTFGGHAYISSIAIVTSIAYAVCKPPMAKILDVFGRAEGLAVSAMLYGVGFLLISHSRSIFTFGCARVIGSAGAQGINLAQQVIVADITSLASRALVTSTIFIPWLVTPWIGPSIGQTLKDMGEAGYRSAYTLYGIVVPISCTFLLLALWRAYQAVLRLTNDARPALAALKSATVDMGVVEADDSLTWEPRSFQALAVEAHNELDLLGIFYLMVGCTLFLLPLSLAADADRGWKDPLYPSLCLSGLAILGILGYHETYIAPYPLIPARLLKQRTVMSGCCLGAFHFFAQFAYESYFPSFLQVARYYNARDASYISESYVFSASIAALLCGYLVKITRRYKIWMIVGILVHMVGAYMMVRFRSLDNSTFDLVISQVIGGFGGGFTTLSAQLGVQALVDHQDIAIVTAVFLTITQIGGAVGGAASGALWTTFLPRKLKVYLPNATKKEIAAIFGSMSTAMSYAPGSAERDGINKAYVEVQRYLNLTALIGLLPALFFAFCMKNVKLSAAEPDNEGESVVMLADVMDESDDESHENNTSAANSIVVQTTPSRQ